MRQAWRGVARMPGVAAVVIGSLAIGIGVNAAVFTWVQALVFRPIPGVQDAAAFHLVEPRTETGSYPGVSWREYLDLRHRVSAFQDLVAYRPTPLNLGAEGQTERAFGQLVSGNFFAALGLQPVSGRLIEPDDVEAPGGRPVVVVSHGFWRSRLGGLAAPVGRVIRVNGRDLTIVGVAPRYFQGTTIGLDFDLWMPATLAPSLMNGSRELDDRNSRGYWAMGRLRAGVSAAGAQGQLTVAMQALAREFPDSNAATAGEVVPFWQSPRGAPRFLLPAVETLQAILILLLLAVCGNAANLMLARASTRQREAGIRLALGAGPWRLAGLFVGENLLMAAIGAVIGLVLASWGANALRAVQFTAAFPIRFQTDVNGGTVLFAFTLAILCGLAIGAAPAWYLARSEPSHALCAGAKTAGRGHLRHALMAAEVTLAVVVLIVAAFFLQSLRQSQFEDPGFDRHGVLLAAYDLTGRNTDGDGARAFAVRLLAGIRALPAVESAALSTSVPLDIHGLPSRAFSIAGRVRPGGSGEDRALSNVVTSDYLRTLAIPIVAGRDFADLEDTVAPRQVIVNEEFVRRYLAGADPIGRDIDVRDRRYAIVGVARDSLYNAFGEPAQPIIYFSYRDRPSSAGEIHLRTRPGHEQAVIADVRRLVREIDPSLPVYDVRTLAEHVEKNLVLRRIPARLFAVLGPLLVGLAAAGIYAVVAYVVSRRTAEIALRLALGATPARVVREVVAEHFPVIVAGAATGWLLAFGVFIHLAPGVAIDPLAFAGAPAMLLAVSALACWLPASRAARVDPMTALKPQ